MATRWGFDRAGGCKRRPVTLVRRPGPGWLRLAPTLAALSEENLAAHQRLQRGLAGAAAYGGALHRMAKPRGLRRGVVLAADHPAVLERRPLFPGKVVAAGDAPRLLVEGINSRKIGARVTKGRWRGLPIYTLTLPERSTCPSRCSEWRSCYGNNTPHARRHALDDALIARLGDELARAARRHRAGFVVRIHVLGDFGSPDDEPLALRYVQAWADALDSLPQLRVFGFTAHDPDEEIGSAILGLNLEHPDRCRIRFSGTSDADWAQADGTGGGFGALVIASRAESRHVVCPAQDDSTDCCGTCGLCWTMSRTVEFVRH